MNAFWILFSLCLLGWGILCVWLTVVYRPRYVYRHGMELLSQLPEGEYIQVCEHMVEEHRHWRRAEQLNLALPGVNFVVQDHQSIRLIACRQGLDYVVDANVIGELAANVQRSKAAGAALIAQSTVDRTTRQIAGKQHIELMDGERLWPMLQPLLPESLLKKLNQYTSRIILLWMGLATVVLLVATGGLSILLHGPFSEFAQSSKQDSPSSTQGLVSDHGGAAAPASADVLSVDSNEPNPRALAQARQAVNQALVHQPGITRSVWLSPSTLAIDRTVDDEQVWQEVCVVLGQHPELGGTRVQLNPRDGSNESIHWRQCSSY